MAEAEIATDALLAEYRRMRDFAQTPEPAGGTIAGEHGRLVFAVQKHDASNLHYDFRLEMSGVLKSWAVPKGPSLDPADRRLAVMTEDHPLEYAAFEGVIPRGEYGGGTVLLWDFGWWEPDLAWIRGGKTGRARPDLAEQDLPGDAVFDAEEALERGELKMILHGRKLTGSWALVQMKGRGRKNWLLLKHRDQSARPGYSVVEASPGSVLSGRSLQEIAGS